MSLKKSQRPSELLQIRPPFAVFLVCSLPRIAAPASPTPPSTSLRLPRVLHPLVFHFTICLYIVTRLPACTAAARRDAAATPTTTQDPVCDGRAARLCRRPNHRPRYRRALGERLQRAFVLPATEQHTSASASPLRAALLCFAVVHHHRGLLLFRRECCSWQLPRPLASRTTPATRVAAHLPGSPARSTLASSCTTRRRYRSTARSQTPFTHRRPPPPLIPAARHVCISMVDA